MIIDFDRHTFATVANCGHDDLCEHTFFVAQKLEAMLEDPKSELVKRISGRDPAEKDLQKTFSLLQSLARNAELEQSRRADVSVDAEKPLQRFVWDLSKDDFGDYVLRPMFNRRRRPEAGRRAERTVWRHLLIRRRRTGQQLIINWQR